MNAVLLHDLADLYEVEAHEAEDRGDFEEADRLYKIAEDLYELCREMLEVA